MVTRPVRALVVLVATVLLLLGSGPAAEAHAYLVRTNPGDGATVERAPRELTLSFSEHVNLAATRIEVVDGDGHHVRVSDLRLATADEDTETPSAIVATLPDLPTNSYRVSWHTLSSDDLHETSGLFVFGVGRHVVPSDFVEPVPSVQESGLRWLLLLGVALLLGAPLVVARLRGLEAVEPGRRVLRRLAVAGGVGAVVTSAVLLADQVAPAAGVSPGRLLTGAYGARWVVRELGLLLLTAVALLGLRGPARRLRRPLLLAGALLTGLGTAVLGHAGAGLGSGSTRVLVTAVHVVAVTTWAGGVLCLAVLLAPGVLPGRSPVVPLRTALRAFAAPAGACVAVAVVTGVWLAGSVVVSVDALIATTYGRTLVLKVALVSLMGLAALANHRRLRGRHDLDLPRRGVRVEAALGVLVLAATGVLASGQPATEARFLTPPPATAGPLVGQVADLEQSVRLSPNRPGRDVVLVDLFDTRRPSPGPVLRVDLRVGDLEATASPLGDGHWSADLVDVPAGPTWVTVTVHRAGLPDVVTRQRWTVASPPDGQQRIVSDAPVGRDLHLLAAGLAGLLAAAGGLVLARRGLASRRTPRTVAHEPEPSRGDLVHH